VRRLLLVTESLPASTDDFRGAWILDFVEALRKQGIQTEVFTIAAPAHDNSINLPVYGYMSHIPEAMFADSSAAHLTSYFRARELLQTSSRMLAAHLQEHHYDYAYAGAFPMDGSQLRHRSQ
jgi:hypothetical protein